MATESASTGRESYDQLLDHYERIYNVKQASRILSWDQQVMMPDKGTPARSKQLSTLSGLSHELITDEDVAALLDAIDETTLDEPATGAVREIRRDHRRADAVPQELVEEISEATSNAVPVWEEARSEDDFEAFSETLENLLELKREYAHHIDPDRDPYTVLFEDYEPYLDLETAERILEELRETLVPLIDELKSADVSLASPFADGTYPEDAQEEVLRTVLDDIGFDWDRGRLDTSSHPFSSGNQFDARITTRFDESEPLDSLSSTIHEYGHASYSLGLPQDQYGTPLGASRDLVVHESQSRFWENHIGRTQAFWDRHAETLEEHFDEIDDISSRELFEAANRIYPENLIRVEADELTYHLHIILRFEIERDLVAGDLSVSEVPEVWNDKMESYLGIRPETDADGCLQDIHWSHGMFGYFPTYSLGSVLAAQLNASLREEIDDVDAKIRGGEFDPLRDWMTQEIHQHGRRYTTPDLIESATGEPLTAEYFLDYATEKFETLYDI